MDELHAHRARDWLERGRWRQLDTGQSDTRAIRHLFLMTDADPNTAWLKGCVALDDKGFVRDMLSARPGPRTSTFTPALLCEGKTAACPAEFPCDSARRRR